MFTTGRILLSLCVDNMIITGDNIEGTKTLKSQLARQFEIEELGTLQFFLGIEVTSSSISYLISQSKYIADILKHACIADTQTTDTSLEINVRSSLTDGVPLLNLTFCCIIFASLVYLTIARLEIAHAADVVSQFVSSHIIVHWVVVIRIMDISEAPSF